MNLLYLEWFVWMSHRISLKRQNEVGFYRGGFKMNLLRCEIFKNRLNFYLFHSKKAILKDLVPLEQLIHELRKWTFQLIKLGPFFNVIILVEPLILDLSTNSQNTQKLTAHQKHQRDAHRPTNDSQKSVTLNTENICLRSVIQGGFAVVSRK